MVANWADCKAKPAEIVTALPDYELPMFYDPMEVLDKNSITLDHLESHVDSVAKYVAASRKKSHSFLSGDYPLFSGYPSCRECHVNSKSMRFT